MEFSDLKHKLPGVALALSFGLMAACSSGGGAGADDNSGGEETTKACAGGETCGVLDDVQVVLDDTLAGAIGSQLPEPLGPVVGCAANTVNNVVDVPDALLVGLQDAATSQDPAALVAAFDSIGNSLGNAAFNLQGLLTTLAGSESTCNEAGDVADGGDTGGDNGDGGDAAGPTGTPLDLALAPLMDGLDTLVSTLQDSAAGTPAAAVVDPIVEGLDALLAVLEGGDAPGGDSNPLTDALAQLQDQLAGLAGGSFPGFPGGDGGGNVEDADLEPLTDVLDTVVSSLGLALANGQTGLEDAAGSEVPVISGLLTTLSTALADTGSLVDQVGQYNGVDANAEIENLLENLLGNVLTQVIPLELIGEQTGQDIAGPVRDGIAQGVSALGDGTELLIDPLLSDVLDDAASPLLDPIEGILAQLLAASPVDLGDTLGGGIGQLTDALTGLAGQGGSGGGSPLDALLGGLPSGGAAGEGPTGTPADLLLGALVENDPTGVLAGILGPLGGVLQGLFGQLGALAP